MEQTVEYFYQRPSVAFLIGWAKALGINVIVYDSNVCKTEKVYMYDF